MTGSADGGADPGRPDPATFGSVALASALAARDDEAIGRALRLDYVVVPTLEPEQAGVAPQFRVFPNAEDAARFDLLLFSSAATFERFLPVEPDDRAVRLISGPTLQSFLEQNRAHLARVVFDARGPHPLAADVGAVLDALRPRADDDPVAWVAQGGAPPHPISADPRPVTGFRLEPTGGFVELSIRDAAGDELEARIAGLTRRLSRRIRAERTAWATLRLRAFAADPDARTSVVQVPDRSTVIVGVQRWIELEQAPAAAHLDTVAELMHAETVPGDLRLGDPIDGAPALLRRREDADPTAAQGRVFAWDFVLARPDGRGLCWLRFETPSPVNAVSALQPMPLVGSGRWTRA